MTSSNGSAARATEDCRSRPGPMADNILPQSADPAEAFNALRGQIALLQTALEGLTAAREKIPDYTDELRRIVEYLRGLDRRLTEIEGKPALATTPTDFSAEMVRCSVVARDEDRRLVQQAHQNVVTIYAQLRELVRQADGAEAQRMRYYYFAGGGAAVGGSLVVLIIRAFV